jgi:citrate synthase
MNIAIVCASLAADQGLTEDEYYHYAILSFSGGALPCYIDAREHPIGSFFPLEPADVLYKGHSERPWTG